MSSIDPNDAFLDRVPTPSLVVDREVLDSNISRMANTASRLGISLRPHAKTHKSPDIARRQREAGAVGIACATLLEAAALVHQGIEGIMITSPVVGRDKVRELTALHQRSPLIVAVDHAAHVETLAAAVGPDGPPLGVLVDIDVGQSRGGVVAPEAAVFLARFIAGKPRLRFAGIQGFGGHVQHIVDAEERRAASMKCAEIVRGTAAYLTSAHLSPFIVSGSGTGTSQFDMGYETYTELQVGSYVFMDADYGRLRQPDGTRLPYGNCLFVLATVVSVNRRGQITVDAGSKALAVNGPVPDCLVGVPRGSSYRFAGDEHGVIELPTGALPPPIGSRVLIVATHCDPTVNLYGTYHVLDQHGKVERWPIVGRHATAPKPTEN